MVEINSSTNIQGYLSSGLSLHIPLKVKLKNRYSTLLSKRITAIAALARVKQGCKFSDYKDKSYSLRIPKHHASDVIYVVLILKWNTYC